MNKTTKIQISLTDEERQQLEICCKEYEKTVSDFFKGYLKFCYDGIKFEEEMINRKMEIEDLEDQLFHLYEMGLEGSCKCQH